MDTVLAKKEELFANMKILEKLGENNTDLIEFMILTKRHDNRKIKKFQRT